MGMAINHRQTRDSRDAGKSGENTHQKGVVTVSTFLPRVEFVSLFDSVQQPLNVLYLAE